MQRVPLRFLEGCLIAAHAIEAKHVFIYIRGEYDREFEVLRSALDAAARRRQLLGGVTIVLHRGAGAYICGEETALLESLEGERGQPRTKPPFPAIAGLYAVADRGQQRRVDHDGAADPRARRRASTRSSASRTRPARASSRSRGNVVNGGNYELEPGRRCAT